MKTKQKILAFTALSLMTVFSCTKDDNSNLEATDASQEKIQQPSSHEEECSYVDRYWPRKATLSSTLTSGAGTSADVTLMFAENTNIKTFWRGTSVAAPTFQFVRNGTDWNSTYNAISYSTGKIYYGEGIFRDAKAKDNSNLINVLVLAHEYGHQLQYAFNIPSVRETTARANELEADGMAGYYLRRGYGKTTYESIATAYEFAFSIGDTYTTSSGHHGTPAQRRSAVRLGFLLADPANAKFSATQFDSNFFFYYSGVLAGTYKMARPEGMSQSSHEYIMSHMDEIRRIQSGQMSDEEYFKLQ